MILIITVSVINRAYRTIVPLKMSRFLFKNLRNHSVALRLQGNTFCKSPMPYMPINGLKILSSMINGRGKSIHWPSSGTLDQHNSAKKWATASNQEAPSGSFDKPKLTSSYTLLEPLLKNPLSLPFMLDSCSRRYIQSTRCRPLYYNFSLVMKKMWKWFTFVRDRR